MFLDGKTIKIDGDSSANNIVIKVKSFADLDNFKAVITEKNINGAILDGKMLDNMAFVGVRVSLEEDNIRADFTFRNKTDEEVLKERIEELEDAVNFLLMKGEE